METIDSTKKFNNCCRSFENFIKCFCSKKLFTQLEVFLTVAQEVAYCQVNPASGTLWSGCKIQAIRVGEACVANMESGQHTLLPAR